MELKELADLLTVATTTGDLDVEINEIRMNSKHVRQGDLFVCIAGIPGFQEDRHQYAEEAVRAGAVALVVEQDVNLNVPTIKVSNARYAMAVFANHLNHYPSAELKLIGVTGTNGKTTTSHMLESILAEAGYKTGLMGNLGTQIGTELIETDINTQEPPALQATLRKMKEASVDYCVMEVTSQGLDAGRVLGCDYRTVVFTNLTQDHLDYHGSMENYRAAKGLLFSSMGNGFSSDSNRRKFAVLNTDDPASEFFRKITGAQVITYGINNKADVMAKDIQLTANGTNFQLHSFAGEATICLKTVGTFNVYNALAAVAASLAEQIPLEAIQQGLANFKGVSGRMELVDEGQDFLAIVDFAHTPDGLENILSTVRGFAQKKVITVFGCGGDRDRTKRPIMGGIAAKYSDYVIVTSDNPRTENPEQILKDIEDGLTHTKYELIEDRKQAIFKAVSIADTNDVLVIAGKGHETYQILNNETIHFDDREELKAAIRFT
ncbi:UDP-N-acetylmuramoyl-L-alanyl-D-glutamate--2,6-diaminopimelate ligase [Paenibacillus marinisediminis]